MTSARMRPVSCAKPARWRQSFNWSATEHEKPPLSHLFESLDHSNAQRTTFALRHFKAAAGNLAKFKSARTTRERSPL